MSQKGRVLVVDDDENVTVAVEQTLCAEGYAVQIASNLFQARGAVERSLPDLIILDRRLPDGDGAHFCTKLRADETTKAVPILFLTAKKGVPDRVLGLEVGGDDYLAKPFAPEELVARVEAILRRTSAPPARRAVLAAGPLRLDLTSHRAFLNDKELDLWPKEYDMTAAFLEHKNRLLTREFLLQRVWGAGKEMELTGNVVDVTLHALRKKLGGFGERIVTVRGYGFRFDFETDK